MKQQPLIWTKKTCNHLLHVCHNYDATVAVPSCCLYWCVMYLYYKRNCAVYQSQQMPSRCHCSTQTSNLIRMIRHHNEFELKSEGPASDAATVLVIDKLPCLQTPHALGQLITFPMDRFMRNRSVYSQTSTVHEWIISFNTLLSVWLLNHTAVKVKPCY